MNQAINPKLDAIDKRFDEMAQSTRTINKILSEKDDVVLFAYLFGSHSQGTATTKSDIDIAVYLKDQSRERLFDIKICLYLELSRALKRNDIDLVMMNTCKNVVLLHRIITHGVLIYNRDEAKVSDYEQKILHAAIDFKYQRQMAMGV